MAELSQVTFPSCLKMRCISKFVLFRAGHLCHDCISGCELRAVLLVCVVVEDYIWPPDPISGQSAMSRCVKGLTFH